MIGSAVAKPTTMPRTSVLEQSGFVRNDDATTLAGLSFGHAGLNIVELFWDQLHSCHPSPVLDSLNRAQVGIAWKTTSRLP
jgi:hypothetical protein